MTYDLPLDFKFTEGRLFQEDLAEYPFHFFTCCILCNRTTGQVARRAFLSLVDKYRSPKDLLSCTNMDVIPLIKCAGFQISKAMKLRRLAESVPYAERPAGLFPLLLHEKLCTPYMEQSYRVVVLQDLTFPVTDRVLGLYVKQHAGGSCG